MIKICSCYTVVGKIGVAETDGWITNLYFANDGLPPESAEDETPLLREAVRQLDQYLNGGLKKFTLPLLPGGTPFMKRIWSLLNAIPYGHTTTYKEIAVKAGNKQAARAVGMANNRNPLPIFIPCHRVVGANGSLTGYRGGLNVKQRLLSIEGKYCNELF